MKKTDNIKKIILCLLVTAVTVLIMAVLSRPAGIADREEEVIPPIFDTPSYVELYDGDELTVNLRARENITLGSFLAVMVNTRADGTGTINFSLYDPAGSEMFSANVSESSVSVGEWTAIGNPGTDLEKDKTYKMLIAPKGCDVFFIKTLTEAANKVLPFDEEVEGKDCGISLGAFVASGRALTYGDVFYHSRMICIVLALFLILVIVFGFDRIRSVLEGAFTGKAFKYCLNNIFLIVLFVTICFSIYINGYLERINISADSAGYLREAVNLAAGNGFNYDAAAGYKGAWFANWPILYPFLIACVMKLTGLEVYVASKVLSMFLVGLLLLILRIVYRDDAWFFALTTTNLGLMYLYWYSWSELPFIVFMLLFAISLERTMRGGEIRIIDFVLTGVFAFLCFLTRYFGMFTYFVIGAYVIALIAARTRGKRDVSIKKIVGLIVTAGASGFLCLLYLLINKLKNGMPSGVSRTMWWDDYQSLTNDLIRALTAEFFNFFHVEVPVYISELTYSKRALLVILFLVAMLVIVCKKTDIFSREGVLIATSVIYYVMFIVIRYFSSMDIFYYRFFAPATFLFTLGIFGILIRHIGDNRGSVLLIAMLTVFVGTVGYSHLSDHILKQKFPYYETIKMGWDEEYALIPERSVVIFSTIDYRSQYYRADVVEGTIEPSDTMQTLRERYYGSRNMCILSDDARAMLESGIYDESINKEIMTRLGSEDKYLVIPLMQ